MSRKRRLDDIDIYIAQDHAAFPRTPSLMSSNRKTTHRDPALKLALGWVTPTLNTADAVNTITDVTTSNRYVLPRYNSTVTDEYYLIENRRSDAAPPHDDDGIADSGIAVWHVVSDETQMALPPIGVTTEFWNTAAAAMDADDPGNYGKGTLTRWGIRLLRSFESIDADGVAQFDSKDNTLWDSSEYDLHTGPCAATFTNVLAWADCQPSGYHIEFNSFPAASMQVEVSID